MNDPIKIIFKYKNNHRRVQYNTYIFIGDISTDIYSILMKIEKKKLYESLLSLHIDDIKKLEKYYGVFWYKKFFNSYHINNTILQIIENENQKKELNKKFGKDWFNVHVERFDIIDKKIIYNYSTYIKNEFLANKKKKKAVDDDVILYNYQTKKRVDRLKLQSFTDDKKIPKIKSSTENSPIVTETVETSLSNDQLKLADALDHMDFYDYKMYQNSIKNKISHKNNHLVGGNEGNETIQDPGQTTSTQTGQPGQPGVTGATYTQITNNILENLPDTTLNIVCTDGGYSQKKVIYTE